MQIVSELMDAFKLRLRPDVRAALTGVGLSDPFLGFPLGAELPATQNCGGETNNVTVDQFCAILTKPDAISSSSPVLIAKLRIETRSAARCGANVRGNTDVDHLQGSV